MHNSSNSIQHNVTIDGDSFFGKIHNIIVSCRCVVLEKNEQFTVDQEL